MFDFLKNLSASKAKTGSNSSSFPPKLVFRSGATNYTANDLDDVFYGVLLGATSRINAPLNPFEQDSLRQLNSIAQIANTADVLPRLPAILPKLIGLLREENSSTEDIAKLIEQDQILVADVIRLVNSPYYRTRQKITSLKQATVLLGRDGLQQLVSGALLRPLMNIDTGHFVKLSARLLWDHAQKTALATSRLDLQDEELRFFAYLSGILQNLGFIVGCMQLDKKFDGSHSPNSIEFLRSFVKACRGLSATIALNWQLPPNVIETLETLATLNDKSNHSPLTTTVYTADYIAKTQILADRIHLNPEKIIILLNNQPCNECLDSYNSIVD